MTKQTHTDNPHDLLELGKKYPALQKQFNELRIICDNALTEKSKAKRQGDELKILSDNAIACRFIAEGQRDELLEMVKRLKDTLSPSDFQLKIEAEQLIKSNKK